MTPKKIDRRVGTPFNIYLEIYYIYGGECFWRVPLDVPLGHQEKGYHRKGSPRKVSFPRKHSAAVFLAGRPCNTRKLKQKSLPRNLNSAGQRRKGAMSPKA